MLVNKHFFFVKMDSDTTYRMILSSGVFIIGIIITGILWPRKVAQKHYDSPLLRVQPRDTVELSVIETPIVETPRDECLLCHWENNFNTPEITRLFEIIDRSYGQMSTHELAKMVHLYYKQKILTDESTVTLELSMVTEHLEGLHKLDAKMAIGESIRNYKKIMDLAKGKIQSPDGTINHNAFIVLENAQNKLQDLYSIAPALL